MSLCLYCYDPLAAAQVDFHPLCSRKFFGRPQPPQLPYTADQMLELAGTVIRSQKSVTGVQPKLSLELERTALSDTPQRFTIVGLWGGYILKPPAPQYPFLPELEDTTMHLAELAGVRTVPHSLIRLADGHLAYITKRLDREADSRIHMEDMCQLTEKMTEQKYAGSYEQIDRALEKYSVNPGLDRVNFYEQVVFSFLTGNADMHLKNFSLIRQARGAFALCPAYDLVPSALVVKGDDEDLALTLNGKKKKITIKDFQQALDRAGIAPKTKTTMFGKFRQAIPVWREFIQHSFLPKDLQTRFITLIEERTRHLTGLD